MNIIHLQRQQIDPQKWNACVNGAANGLIYSSIAYLDAMCPAWSALVLDDYRAVMPVTARRKWGFAYLYQPYLTAQTGITGNDLTAQVVEAFFAAIPATFRYWDIALNWGNLSLVRHPAAYTRRNYVLPLDAPYETISTGYRNVVKRNVRKAARGGCRVERNIALHQVLQLALRYTPGTKGHKHQLGQFAALFSTLQKGGSGVAYGVYAKGGELLASALFLLTDRRAYYILVGNDPEGRRTGASHLLIDAFIQDHAGKAMVLDFEGSDVPGLAFFYSSFGAQEENYPAIRWNGLPPLLRWLKRS